MKDLVSVIVTCYNHGPYIAQCLNSIFEQTYRNIELLVINDGSTDDSGEVIEQNIIQSPFEHTEYLVQKNAGICVTRNRGLEWAQGTFLLFVDSDNYLDPDFIEKLIHTAEVTQGDIIYTDLFNVDTQATFMEAKKFELKSYLASNYIDNCSLIRRAKIQSCRYDVALNRKKLVDYDFIMSLILLNHAVPVKCAETKVNYRVLEDSISRKNDHESELFYYEVYLYIITKYIATYPTEIMDAVKENILTLSQRLVDLIQHLNNVDGHVHNQENTITELFDQIEVLKKEIEVRKTTESNLLFEKNELLFSNQYLENVVSIMQSDKDKILHSTSYRLGNLLVKPLNYGKQIIKNPKLIFRVFSKIKRSVIKNIHQLPNPKTNYLKKQRVLARNQNNYNHPKRILIFVIYEGQDHLQEYKLLFLNSLAAFVDEVLIVINGNLPQEDIAKLTEVGHVETRENSGYDTAAFRYGIQYLGKDKLSKYDELLLVNDTNVGPIHDFSDTFEKMAEKKLDFWGISYGEEQNDFTGYNKYGYIPIHLQSYFLVIEKSLLLYDGFYDYWQELDDTDARDKAIGKHETVFTKHFENLGFIHGALAENNVDSPMYIHPLRMAKEGIPIVKYTAFANYTDDKFAWQGLSRTTEVPALLDYLASETKYPMDIINQIMLDMKTKKVREHILIIDGVENVIPQLTKYRVQNKKEQLESLGHTVWVVNLSDFQMGYAENASMIIIYRAPLDGQLIEMIQLAKKYNKAILYDIDDLVIDTKFTNQLNYVQQLSEPEKRKYDQGVINYGEMMKLCDGVVTSTKKMKEELLDYKELVILNRNLANQELVEISQRAIKPFDAKETSIKIGYFSGSITHNENFELIKPAVLQLLEKHQTLELHLVGHLDLPDDLKPFKQRIKTHAFVDWKKLPELISEIDINIAPLVDSIFNEAKSEIKWIEAALVKVPTVASNLGAFKEMIIHNETGVLVDDSSWFGELNKLIESVELRKHIAEKAYEYVIQNCLTIQKKDELVGYIDGKSN